MTKDEVLKLAREVGLPHWYETEGVVNEELLIKFAALVIANNPPQSSMAWQEGYSQGRLDESLEAEREAREAVEFEREKANAHIKRLEEQAYDLVGELRAANIKLSMRPQRTWVGLTDEDIALIDWESLVTKKDCVKAIEAKLKEKNNA